MLSDRHGSGKHVLIDLIANSLNITLIRLNEDTNIDDLVLRDNNSYDITSFFSSTLHSPSSRYFVVEQCAIRKTSLLNATFKTQHPCMLQSNFIDSFDRFNDTRDRCKDETFAFEDRVRMGVSHSYALFQYTYTSVIENCRDPWHKEKSLSIDGMSSWTELFSFTDAITRNEQSMMISMFLLN